MPEQTGPQEVTPSPQRAKGEPVGRATRAAFLLALVLLAVMLVTSAGTGPSDGPRLGGRIELIELIRQEQVRSQAMATRVEELSEEVAAIQRASTDDGSVIAGLQRQVDALVAPAGMTGLTGPGATVTLRDSAAAPVEDSDYNDYVIHEQDLQAVINALWAGGAEGMAVNGNRILTTTAIRCVGNVLLLHGATYSPPYVIKAVGDPLTLVEELRRDTAVARFEQAVLTYQLGFEVEGGAEIGLPAYEGAAAIRVAEPVESGA